MTATLSCLRSWLHPPSRADAETAFLRLSGSAAPVVWMEWLPGLALLGAALVILWLLPLDWLASLPRPWAAVLGWGVLVAVPAVAETIRADRSRMRLAEAFATADCIVGSTFLRFPGSLVGAAALLVASSLPGFDVAAWIAAALAAQGRVRVGGPLPGGAIKAAAGGRAGDRARASQLDDSRTGRGRGGGVVAALAPAGAGKPRTTRASMAVRSRRVRGRRRPTAGVCGGTRRQRRPA